MSVVNTMLRELAERQSEASDLPGANATPAPRRIPPSGLVAIPLIAVAILLWRLGLFSAADETASVASPTASLNSETNAAPEPTRLVFTATPPASTADAVTTDVPVIVAATNPTEATANPASDAPAGTRAETVPAARAPASIGWEAVDFSGLNDSGETAADIDTASVDRSTAATPAEPTRFERTLASETVPALLTRVRQQARQAIAVGDWQEANEAIRSGTAVAPEDPELALLHVESEALRDPSIAEQTATAVLNELPQAWPVRQWLGLRWLQMQQPKRAYGVLTTLAPPLNTAPDYHNLLALAAQQSGEHKAAATIYQQLISLQPNLGRHQAGLAMSLEALGDHAGARSSWQQALRDPQLPVALIRYGQSRLQQLPPTSSSAQASP